ncbi:MAG TPA: hypothetical protein VJZ76_04545 [Thermoanaerobaculia bacterium]|nr:hypothetical protein [Thermoanaerobaculia bacterium]
MRKWLAIGALWLWIAIAFMTHFGARSPYSYGWAIFRGNAARILGTVVNPDAIVVQPVTMYFYDARTPENWGNSPNFRLPFHSFLVATLAAFTRSYLASNYIANVGALMLLAVVAVNLAIRRGLQLWPATIALLTFAALPWLVTYVGQPMHYIVGIAINFLAVLAASALPEEDLRRPWLSGLLLAIVLLNYDAYVFAAALAAYALFVVRFRRAIDYAVFVAVSAAPVIVWTQFLRFLTHDTLSRMIERTFIQPVMNAWLDFLRHPLTYPLRPFLAGHVGLHIGAHFLLAMVYWPVLVLCVAGAWRLRERPAPLVALLLAFYALHQLATAAFDWENNPRRALPAILALAFVYCWLADRLPRWRIAFVAALAISCVLAMADTLLNTPAVAFLTTGQAIQHNPKEPITIGDMRFNHETMPTLMADEPAVWHDLGAGRVPRPALSAWLFAQLFNAFFVCALLWLLGRAALLPRWAAVVGAVIWLVSAVRFI